MGWICRKRVGIITRPIFRGAQQFYDRGSEDNHRTIDEPFTSLITL